jgi:hypothetical protein
VANLLVTVSQHVSLSLKPGPDSKVGQIFGSHAVVDGALQLGTLQYGQRRDVIVRVSVPEGSTFTEEALTATLSYENITSKRTVTCENFSGAAAEVEPQRIRLAAVDAIRNAMQKVGKVKDLADNADRLAAGDAVIKDFQK